MLFSTLAGSSYAPANGAQELQFLLFFFFLIVCGCGCSLSYVPLFVTLWTTAHQASPSFTFSWSLLRLMSAESMMSLIFVQ